MHSLEKDLKLELTGLQVRSSAFYDDFCVNDLATSFQVQVTKYSFYDKLVSLLLQQM